MDALTEVLAGVERGEPEATERLLPLVYDELRRLAARELNRERPGMTLQPTALVHEVYLRLTGAMPAPCWEGRGHFFAAAAQAMRRILVEDARRKGRLKRGGGRRRELADLDALQLQAGDPDDDLLALHEALDRFADHDPAKARLVELRFFGGLTLEQAAECLGISPSTADRSWRYARAWLYSAMAGNDLSEKKSDA
jgi:RNA polymerase sigma factor (TIGR02999 family)